MSFDSRNEGKAIMDRTYLVATPNGATHEINVFDFNLASFCDPEKFIQTSCCKGWNKFKNFTLLKGQ